MGMKGENWHLCDFDEAIAELERTKQLFLSGQISYMVFDTETSIDLRPWAGGDIIMFSWAHKASNIGYAVPLFMQNTIHHPELPYQIPLCDFEITLVQRRLLIQKASELLHMIPIIGHNLKYDTRWLVWHNWINIRKVKILADTLIMGFQLFNKVGGKGSLTLKTLTNKLCDIGDNWEWETQDYISRFKKVADRHYGNLPTGLLGPYAAKDGIYNLMLYEKLLEMMPANMHNIANIVTYATKPFTDAETKGLFVDQQMKSFLQHCYTEEQAKLRKSIESLPTISRFMEGRLIPLREKNDSPRKRVRLSEEELRKKAFNLNSDKQLIEVMYGKDNYSMDVVPKFKTKGGAPQTGKDVIEYFLDQHISMSQLRKIKEQYNDYMAILKIPSEVELAQQNFTNGFAKMLEFREFLGYLAKNKRLEKLRTTYINPVDENCCDGLYKPEFSLAYVVTGRLSSGFHTLPNECDIKRMYISRWENIGGLFLVVDQSQLELRIAASLAHEIKMIEAYKRGIDIHRLTGSNIYKVELDAVTAKQRAVGKTTNFAVLFGKMAKNLAEDLNCTVQEAENILIGFFGGYDSLTTWMENQKIFARQNGYIVTPWGRKIPIPESVDPKKWVKYRGDRLSVNYPVQSSASDVVLSGVNGSWNRLGIENLNTLMVGSVHDSIEMDVYPGELFHTLRLLQEECVDKVMESQKDWLLCPLELSVELGRSWGGCLESKVEELTPTSVILRAEGLRKDFLQLEHVAKRAYNISIDVLKKEELTDKDFGADMFVRDSEFWEARIAIQQKS